MTALPRGRFEVCDDDLPDRPPLAAAATYSAALAEVARLHHEFFASLAANGEGGTGLSQRLRVDEVPSGGPPRARYWSSVGGPP
jgi:hypothetical protein